MNHHTSLFLTLLSTEQDASVKKGATYWLSHRMTDRDRATEAQGPP